MCLLTNATFVAQRLRSSPVAPLTKFVRLIVTAVPRPRSGPGQTPFTVVAAHV